MEEMQKLAEELRFEEAQKVKEKYELIENYRSKSEVVSSVIHNIDVFSIETDESSAYINYLHITNGCVNQAFTFEYKMRVNESKEELLQLCLLYSSSVLWKCGNVTKASRKRSSYLLSWTWR
mgnify:CR=1 FL=1